MNVIIEAAQFAAQCHSRQVRKYTGRPYITHPIRVAGRVATMPIASEELVVAGYLHDVVEDCEITLDEIVYRFGFWAGRYVEGMTNTSKQSSACRADRKLMDRNRLKFVSRPIRVLKLIDRIDNLREMSPEQDPKFARLYCDESQLLLEVLRGSDPELEAELQEVIDSTRNLIPLS